MMFLRWCMVILYAAALAGQAGAEPVVVKGRLLPSLINKKISEIRVVDATGKTLPFQIDEMTPDGEYVLPNGEKPNTDAGNGVLDTCDEILFMREDAGTCTDDSFGCEPREMFGALWTPVYMRDGNRTSVVYIGTASQLTRSDRTYLTYDHTIRELRATSYFARFAPDRFHFLAAGIITPEGHCCNLTRELRIEINLKALWGLLPIHYTEDNLVCYVKRYKVGPIRCIRRGDFHLRLGLGLKGSHAAVNQICYPQMVSVPVKVHVPVKFSRFFSEAWIEMTPVIDTAGERFTFRAPSCGITQDLGASSLIDTLYNCMPAGKIFTVTNGSAGFAWQLATDIATDEMGGSGYVVRPTLNQRGIALCGFRFLLREVQRGFYTITNRIFFPTQREDLNAVTAHIVTTPCRIITAGGNEINPVAADAVGIKSD